MALLNFEQVKSSQIKELAYDPDKETLYIRFRNKKLYEYNPISKEEYLDFKESESLGKHFHKYIKKRVIVY